MPRIFCPTLLMFLLGLTTTARAQTEKIDLHHPAPSQEIEKAKEKKANGTAGYGSNKKPSVLTPEAAKKASKTDDQGLPKSPGGGTLKKYSEKGLFKNQNSANAGKNVHYEMPPGFSVSSALKSPQDSDGAKETEGSIHAEQEEKPEHEAHPECEKPELSEMQKKSCRDNEEKAREKRLKSLDTSRIR